MSALKIMNNQLLMRLKQLSSSVSIGRITLQRCPGQINGPGDNDEPWQQRYYKYFLPIQTRWSDNDQYGHVNNIIYYSYFDTIISHYLINYCSLNTDLKTSRMVGYMVDTSCVYRSPISFPEIALAGLAISRVGQSSVQYTIAIFQELPDRQESISHLTKPVASGFSTPADTTYNLGNHSLYACAVGHCVHVFVDTATNRPAPLPDNMRAALEKITVKKTSKL